MEILQGVWKQHRRPRAVVGYGVKIFLPSPPITPLDHLPFPSVFRVIPNHNTGNSIHYSSRNNVWVLLTSHWELMNMEDI